MHVCMYDKYLGKIRSFVQDSKLISFIPISISVGIQVNISTYAFKIQIGPFVNIGHC